MSCKCQLCGKNYYVDLLIPDELWEKIKPTGKLPGAGLICGSCIMERIEFISGYSTYKIKKGRFKMCKRIGFKVKTAKRDFTDGEMEEIFGLTWNGIEVGSDDDVPMPWDVDVSIEKDRIILSGGVGANGFGSCTCKVPIDEADYVYTFSVCPREKTAEEKLKAMIVGIGATITG